MPSASMTRPPAIFMKHPSHRRRAPSSGDSDTFDDALDSRRCGDSAQQGSKERWNGGGAGELANKLDPIMDDASHPHSSFLYRPR